MDSRPVWFWASAGFAEEHDLALTQLVFSTLTRYTALSEQQAVRRVLNKALDSEKFLKTFAAALVRGATTAQGSHECFVLLCWSALVLARLPLPGAKKAIVKLLECQVCFGFAAASAGVPYSVVLIQSDAVKGKAPCYKPGCRENCSAVWLLGCSKVQAGSMLMSLHVVLQVSVADISSMAINSYSC